MKRLVRNKYIALTLAVILTLVPAIAVRAYSNACPNTWSNTGKQATDITEIARTQVGYVESSSNHTKYNDWFYGSDKGVAWCGIFISWCADQAGIPTSVIRKNALASGYSVNNMSANSFGAPAHAFGSTSARPGDIIYVDNTGNGVSNHVGLVVDVDDTYIYTVEGNSSSKVSNVRYLVSNGHRKLASSVSSARIIFYARPSYATGSAATPSVSDSYKAGNYKVTAEELNVRSGPDKTYSILGTLKKGTVIKVSKTDGRFGCFSYNGKIAWASLKYCSPTSESATSLSGSSSSSSDYPTGTYTLNQDMNVRSAASTESSVIGSLSSGTQVKVSKTNGRFGCIDYNGKTAWVSLKYATRKTESSSDSGYSAGSYRLNCEMNVRSGPDTSSSAIGVLKEGTIVKVTRTNGRFGCIDYNGKTAWVSLKYATRK